MAARHVLPALVATGALILPGCGSGSSGDSAAPVAAPAVSPPTGAPAAGAARPATATATATESTSPARKGTGAPPAATVPPDVVVPTTTESMARTGPGGWEAVTLTGLARIDARLVADEQMTIARVRSACDAFSSGLFQAEAVELVRKKFSTGRLRLTPAQGEMIYQVLLRDACYVMGGQDAP